MSDERTDVLKKIGAIPETQLSIDDLAQMTPQEITDAQRRGELYNLLTGNQN